MKELTRDKRKSWQHLSQHYPWRWNVWTERSIWLISNLSKSQLVVHDLDILLSNIHIHTYIRSKYKKTEGRWNTIKAKISSLILAGTFFYQVIEKYLCELIRRLIWRKFFVGVGVNRKNFHLGFICWLSCKNSTKQDTETSQHQKIRDCLMPSLQFSGCTSWINSLHY